MVVLNKYQAREDDISTGNRDLNASEVLLHEGRSWHGSFEQP